MWNAGFSQTRGVVSASAGAPAELFQDGSKVIPIVQGGSKSMNFAVFVVQISKIRPVCMVKI